MTETADDVDAHSELVSTPTGKVLVGAIVALMSFWIVGPNLPASAVRGRVDTLWSPARQAGLVQDWAVFSPNPRSQSIDVRARVEHVDGTLEFWDLPDFDPFTGAYRQYRWNKWQERVRLDDSSNLWEPTAAWIADQHVRNGVLPARVALIRRWIDHEELLDDGIVRDAGWNEFEFYVWENEQ